ncbi:acyl-CoA carboxylase subunit epsilon [Nocardioides nanhaiensis]|uniref:Acyl-CoA carboxylase subunit epsilon n=1 Tax=Nocardioides nanhaiensis TaxID=1476871 RepID=A0ABP8W272_9ACTN
MSDDREPTTDSTPDARPDAQPETTEPQRPVLRVVRGDATPEEVAALLGVVASLGGAAPAPRRPRSSWAHPERLVRRTAPAGPGGWRASGLPR